MIDTEQAIRDQFELLTKDPRELLRMLRDQERETAALDFKAVPDKPFDMDEAAKDLSAMANSEGGFILFGVAQKRDEAASGAQPRPNSFAGFHMKLDPIEVESRIKVIARTKITPPISLLTKDVRLEHEGETHTVIVCAVLPSVAACRPAGARNYFWRRGADGNRAMEWFEIADMFGRRVRPLIAVRARYVHEGRAHRGMEIYNYTGKYQIVAENRGRGSASQLYIRFTHFPAHLHLADSRDAKDPFTMLSRTVPGEFELVAKAGIVLHPGQTIVIHDQYFDDREGLCVPSEIRMLICCQDQPQRRFTLRHDHIDAASLPVERGKTLDLAEAHAAALDDPT